MRKIVENIMAHFLGLKKRDFLLLISVVSIIKCLLLFFVLKFLFTSVLSYGYFSDSAMYETISNNLLLGRGFSLSQSYPFSPTMYKEPGYSLFILLVKLLPHGSINLVVAIQILLDPLIAVLVYLIGLEIFNEKISRLSSLLVALIPIYGEIAFFIMPELIFTLLFSCAILCLIRALKLRFWCWFIASGVLLGISSLFRNAVMPLFLIYPVIILFINRGNIRRGLILRLAVFVLFFLSVTVPWMMRNQQRLGLFSISRRGGELFSHQAYWATNFSPNEWRAYSLYLLSGRLAQKLYPEIIGNDLGEYEYRILMRTDSVGNLLKKYREGEVERITAIEGIKNFIRHPFKFILLSSIIYIQTFKYFESIALMLFSGPLKLVWIMSMLRFFLFVLGIAYTIATLCGIIRCSASFNRSYLILITIAYFHFSLTCFGIIPGALQRHIVPISIFYSYFVIIALFKRSYACTLS